MQSESPTDLSDLAYTFPIHVPVLRQGRVRSRVCRSGCPLPLTLLASTGAAHPVPALVASTAHALDHRPFRDVGLRLFFRIPVSNV
eukprot:3170426-Rhodomonas_salina.1